MGETKKFFIGALWVLSVIMSLILNFNFIGALIVRDWQWIMNNWLCDIGIVILPLYYLGIHCILIFGYKTTITLFKE